MKKLNDLWISMTQEMVTGMDQKGERVDLVQIYLFTTSDGNVKLGIFGYPGEFGISRKNLGKLPSVYNVKNVQKEDLPETLAKELQPNEKIYINCG